MEVETRHMPDDLNMDSLTGFLASPQCIDGDASSPLAIHDYSKLAKVHKQTLIPYLPRIMSTVLSSLSSSSQLHPACVQVVSALAMHTIDSSRDPASNEDTLRSLCRPLLSALSNPHPPHLSAGAACCLQSLVESDRWRCAPLDLQELVCAQGMQGLMDDGMQTVAHMDLMQSLAKISSGVVIQGYGASLLEAGMDILQNSCSSVKRVAAAQLLESVLKIADAELLDLDLSPIVGVLQDCQQDKVEGVRSAAAYALKTASAYASCDNAREAVQVPTGLPRKAHMQDAGLPIGGTPCHGALSPSTPSSNKSVFKRLPLAPLQMANTMLGGTPCHGALFPSTPSSNKSVFKRLPLAPLQMANSALVAPKSRRPAASRLSEYKENVAPAFNSRVSASRDVHKRAWVTTRELPLLWSQSALRTIHMDNRGLFNQDSGGSSPADSFDTDLCCGTEEIYSPEKESASECKSSITSDEGSNLQNQALTDSGELMMTPRELVRTLQFDDEYVTHFDQQKETEYAAQTPDNARCDMGASSENEEGGCYDESNSSSESYVLSSEEDTQVNVGVVDSSSMAKRRLVTHSVSSIKVKGGMSDLLYTCFKEDKAKNHLVTCDASDKVNVDLVIPHDAHGQSNRPNAELKAAMLSQQKTHINVCLSLGGKAGYVFVLAICVGLFVVAGFSTYVANLEASNVLVPT